MAKLRSNRGLTLVEALITVMILVLVSAAIATGLTVATRAQSESIFESESGLLANTINLALSDVLRYAESTGGDTFRLSGVSSEFDVEDEDEVLVLIKGSVEEPLVYDYLGLKMKDDFALTYSDRVFSGSYTLTDATGTLSRTFTFKFKTLITP